MLNYYPALDLNRLAQWMKVLAEPKRLAIFNLLMQGTRCNCELGNLLNMPPNLISHHLSKLRAAGLVEAVHDSTDARWIYYSVDRSALEGLHAALGAFFDPKRIQTRLPNCGPHLGLRLIKQIPTLIPDSWVVD